MIKKSSAKIGQEVWCVKFSDNGPYCPCKVRHVVDESGNAQKVFATVVYGDSLPEPVFFAIYDTDVISLFELEEEAQAEWERVANVWATRLEQNASRWRKAVAGRKPLDGNGYSWSNDRSV